MMMTTNLKAFLDMVAVSELGEKLLKNSDDGYNVIVGGALFRRGQDGKPVYTEHPNISVKIPALGIRSTAAGRYQVLYRYYKHYKKQLGLKDFGHEAQDAIAVQLIKECRALDDIAQGRFADAVRKCNSRWASLPGAGYGQHENKLAYLERAWVKAGGEYV